MNEEQEQARITAELNALDQTGLDTASAKEEATRKITRAQQDLKAAGTQTQGVYDQILNRMIMMVRNMILMQGLRTIWSNAKSYA